MRNVSDRTCRENQNTHSMFSYFFPENRAVYESRKMWLDRTGHMPIRRMRFASRITKAKHTQTQKYVILIAFPQQQWLHERVSMLHYMQIACLVPFQFLASFLLSLIYKVVQI